MSHLGIYQALISSAQPQLPCDAYHVACDAQVEPSHFSSYIIHTFGSDWWTSADSQY